jgi:alkylation response protein AidB-like acyl-CoA dehydrogenase
MTVSSTALTEAPGDPARPFFDTLADVTAHIAATAGDRDRQRRYATAEYDALRDIGFWRLSIPTEHGGLGLGYEDLMEAVTEVAAADGSIGQLPQNHFNTVERIRIHGSREQRAELLRRVSDGAVLGNASAEPRERPPGEAATGLRRVGDGYRLTGRKVYSTGALLADLIAVQARDDAGEQVFALVERRAPGVDISDDWSGFGQRTTASGTTTLDEVPVSALHVLRLPTDPRPRYRVSAQSQLLHCAIDAGIAQGALRVAIQLSREVHGGRGSGATEFADDVLGVSQLGELWVAVQGARALIRQSARGLAALTAESDLNDVLDVFYGVMAAKAASTEAALTVTAALIDIGGASSTRTALGLDRYWRDARTHTVHDALRWKPYSIGRRLISGDVADAWSMGHPYSDVDELSRSSKLPSGRQ